MAGARAARAGGEPREKRRFFPRGSSAALLHGCWIGLLHALLLGAAFAPFNLWFLAPFAVVPLLHISKKRPGRLLPLSVGVWIGVSAFWHWQMHWVWGVSSVGYLPLIAYISIFPVLFVVLMARLRARRRGVPVAGAAAVLWIGIEYLRGDLLFDGYAWYFIAHPMIGIAPMLGASVLGAYGVGLAVLAPVLALVELRGSIFDRARLLQATACALLLALALALGAISGVQRPGETAPVRLAVIQTAVPQDNRTNWTQESRADTLFLLEHETRAAADRGATVVVWPETMYPGFYLDRASHRAIVTDERLPEGYRDFVAAVRQRVLDLSRETGVSIIVGATAYEDFSLQATDGALHDRYDRAFNSAFLVERGRVTDQRYDKLHLTPFGEVMPYIEKWPALQRRLLALGARGMAFNLSRGDAPVTIEPQDLGVSLATPICFEITVAGVCRKLVREATSPVVLVNMTNDGWFGPVNAGREAHLLLSRWRAAELGLPVVRAANTGISAIIDSTGRVVARLDAQTTGLLVADIDAQAPRTAQLVVGDLPGIAALLGAIGVLILGFGRRPDRIAQRPPEARADTQSGTSREPDEGEERTP